MPRFDGEMGNLQAVLAFLNKVETLRKRSGWSDDIIYDVIGSKVQGKAEIWFRTLQHTGALETLAENEDGEQITLPIAWTAFRKMFHAQFVPEQALGNIYERLTNLCLSNYKTSLEFNNTFNSLSAQLPSKIDEFIQMQMYLKNLDVEDVKKLVTSNKDNTSSLRSIQEAVDRVYVPKRGQPSNPSQKG